ncbi:MAG: glycoside hydrolase family 75 protein [Chthoniobacterales bacterium]
MSTRIFVFAFISAVTCLLAACDPLADTSVSPGKKDSSTPQPTPEVFTPSTPDPTPSPTPTPLPTPTPSPTPTPDPTPPPLPSIGRKTIDLSRYYNGITIETDFLAEQSDLTAATERNINNSYKLELRLRVQVPKAATTLKEINANFKGLDKLLPQFPQLLETATVSPAWKQLYENKVNWTRRNASRLNTLLSRHNFYDCDTILELRHPETKRRALFILSDMDVNTDGSDGDRNYTVDDSSMYYLPQTSYRWPKQTKRINPMLTKEKNRLKKLEADYAKPGLSSQVNRELREGIANAKRRIGDLSHFSFLISDADPFIVLPGFMLRSGSSPYKPRIGDYAVVIYNDKIYPAILGDAGPSFKMGETSMRICREIEPKTNAIRRAVNNIRVAYIVFPGSAEKKAAPPDLDAWHARCSELLAELDGSTPALHSWENIIKPWPTPTPSPTPTPTPAPVSTPVSTPSPAPTPASSATPTPDASSGI